MDILLWITLGGLAGVVDSRNENTDEQQELFGNTILVGIVGAVLGGFFVNTFGDYFLRGLTMYSFFVSILGAVSLLWIYRAFMQRAEQYE